MRIIITILLFTFACKGTAQDLIKADVDKLVESYINKGDFDSASSLLVNFANQEHQNNNLDIALDYQIKYRDIVEQNVDYFADRGFTLIDLYSIYGMIFVLQRDSGHYTDAIDTYQELASTIKLYSPDELPFYTNLIASTLGQCKTMPWADSVYCLQDALDVIKQQEITEDNVKQYVWFCRCFNMNRMYNSFDGHIFIQNRIGEIEDWYIHNNDYIHKLDINKFRKEILEYDLEYADLLYLYAGSIGAQDNNVLGAIEIYSKELSFLLSLGIEDELIDIKVASCYANIADNYYLLGNLPFAKQYCDKAYPYLNNQTRNLNYCDLLSSLANIYYNTNQRDVAAVLKLEEIKIREELTGSVSLSDWAQYFLYIVDSDPKEVILQNKELGNVRIPEGGGAYYYLFLGKAFSMLIDTNDEYRDTAELYLHKVDSILLSNIDYYERHNLKNNVLGNLYDIWADHYSRLGERDKSYEYSKKALDCYDLDYYQIYYKVSLKSALLHDTQGVHDFLPRYYYGMEEDLCRMLPILGSVESDIYLGNGEANLYHIPEWASWNPTDSICTSIAYDAALLMKGLTLRYNVLSPYFERHPELKKSKIGLDEMRDSIYIITDENARLIALHQYEIKEREILKEVNDELINVHWKDIANGLNEKEACVEFVKYTANAYSWCDSIPRPHYAALILLPSCSYPIFVNLFDEKDLMEVYNLQPRSYDLEMGKSLYRKLWGKLQNYIEGKDAVFFSPMGLLNLINIELLKDSTGKTAMEKFNLYRISSTRNIISRKEDREFKSIISFGGIDYEKTNLYTALMDSIITRGDWSFLQNTLIEVNHINDVLKAKKVDAKLVTGQNASEDFFKLLDGTQFDAIHIATHGYYIPYEKRSVIPYFEKSDYTKNIQDELFYSGLILSGGQKSWVESVFIPDATDGILSAYEIAKLDLHNVGLVVLSACETGIGDNLYDGIYGLQRGFKKAGANSILMSLWKIDDKATSDFMIHFYDEIAEGVSIHKSYIDAVFKMKKQYEDPYYWASFILLD